MRHHRCLGRAIAGAGPGGTVQGFKGLESDVVVLVGIDLRCMRHPANLYVGASRARAALYVLALADAGLAA